MDIAAVCCFVFSATDSSTDGGLGRWCGVGSFWGDWGRGQRQVATDLLMLLLISKLITCYFNSVW